MKKINCSKCHALIVPNTKDRDFICEKCGQVNPNKYYIESVEAIETEEKSGFGASLGRLFTSKKFVLWATLMAVITIVAFSILAVWLSMSKIHFGLEFENRHISSIKVVRNFEGRIVYNDGRSNPHTDRVEQILTMLGRAGKTNRLSGFMLGHGGSQYVAHNISSGLGAYYIEVTFVDPIFFLGEIENSRYPILTLAQVDKKIAETTGEQKTAWQNIKNNNGIWTFIVPLSDNSNSFRRHVWNIGYGSSLQNSNASTTNRFLSTKANLGKLANYVIDEDGENWNGIF